MRAPPTPPKPPECRIVRDNGFVDIPAPPKSTKSRTQPNSDPTIEVIKLVAGCATVLLIAVIGAILCH